MPGMVTSKVTSRNQTTLPRAVREVLHLRGEESIGYVIRGNRVELVNASRLEHEDTVLDGFLEFLASDIRQRPEVLQTLPSELVERIRALTAGVVIDHDEPIEGAIEL